MKKILLFALLCGSTNIFAQCNVDAGSDKTINCGQSVQLNAVGSNNKWLSLQSPDSNGFFTSVYFTDTNTGYITDYYEILKTTNGGVSWVKQFSGDSLYQLSSIYFTDTDTGYCVGYRDIYTPPFTRIILKTTNGGTNWIMQDSTSKNCLFSVYFPNKNIGYIVGDKGIIIKTTNGGVNWTTQTSGTSNALRSVYFTDVNIGYAVGDPKDSIFKTTNGGVNWTTQTSGTINKYLYSVYFPDVNTGYIVGQSGTILKTTNGGLNWTTQTSGTTGTLYSVYFTDVNTGYAVGYKIILKTINGGDNWFAQNSGTNSQLRSVYFPNKNVGYTIGYNYDGPPYGIILKYINSPFTYSWFPSTGLNNDTTANPIANPGISTTYSVIATNDSGCVAVDSIKVFVDKMTTPSICMVSVDSTSGKNLVIWEKPTGLPIDSFIIYKETTVSGVYSKIASRPYDSLSVFIDTSSAPQVKSASYKISMVDSCGYRTDTSAFHKTMHLNINQGSGTTWNLIWNDYVGFTVSSYDIYRGTNPGNLTLINSTTAGNTSFSDLTAPAGFVYYQVEVVNPNACNPTRVSYNSSRSNVATNAPQSVNEIGDLKGINIFPNPSNGRFFVQSPKNAIIDIYNSVGQKIYSGKITQATKEVDLQNQKAGVYFLQLKTNSEVIIQKILITN
ncbi:MAG: YCF48-related protein [Bacteroidales bacterium]|nr:YCF48-related protein [Bacteroidales bacterium]